MSLTRNDLERDRIARNWRRRARPHLLSDAELEESLWQILQQTEPGADCWVFGYGSAGVESLFHSRKSEWSPPTAITAASALVARQPRHARPAGLVLAWTAAALPRVAYRIAPDRVDMSCA